LAASIFWKFIASQRNRQPTDDNERAENRAMTASTSCPTGKKRHAHAREFPQRLQGDLGRPVLRAKRFRLTRRANQK
jgi:hypothetical protein